MIFDEVGIFPLHGYIPWFCIWLCSPQACNNNNNNNNNNNKSNDDRKRSAALLLLTVKEHFKLTQSAIDFIT